MQQSTHNRAEKQATPQWVSMPERSNMLALRFIVWVALMLGRRAARLFLYPISLYFLLFAGDAGAASKNYLRKALGREPRVTDGLRHIHTFASTVLDRVFLLNGCFDKFDVQMHMDDLARQVVEQRRGCILLGAHLGSFEIMRAYAHEIKGLPTSVVMYEENARKLNSVLKAINPGLAQNIIGLGKIDSMLKVEQALRRGESIGILADRKLNENGASVTCDFFGTPAKFPSGPLRIAYMLKSPVLLMVGVYRGGNRYDLYLEELADMSDPGDKTRDQVLKETQQRYVARIEQHCRDAPYNWFNFFDFWEQE